MAYKAKVWDGSQWVDVANSIVDTDEFVQKSGTTGTVDLSQTSFIPPVQTSGRNRLINGGFSVWQRGTSVRFHAGQGSYGPDRWCGSLQFQNSRTQRTSITAPPSALKSEYCVRVGSSTTTEAPNGTRMRIGQTVESIDSIPLRGKVVTLSFWIKFSSATFSSVSNSAGGGNSAYGNFNYSLWNITSTTDGPSNTTGPNSETTGSIINGSLPTSWTKYTLTATLNSSINNLSVAFQMDSLGSTAAADTNWYEVAEVQLEEGPVATPFEFKSYGKELAECQRYYWQSWETVLNDWVGMVWSHGTQGSGLTTGMIVMGLQFPNQMRSAPTITFWDQAGTIDKCFASNPNSSNFNNQTVSAAYITTKTVLVTRPSGDNASGMSVKVRLNAEL